MTRFTTALGRLTALALLAALIAPAVLAQSTPVSSESDPRSYRALILANGLRVILASDPGTDMAAASLSVGVGSGSDPRDREGLAHFLEHMLFLGTEKYPEPGEYKDFITRHGGRDNAYTAFDETNYFFEIAAPQLEPALDRFAQFFVAPLFNAEYVERERQVVHSEFLGRRDDDRRRIHSAATQAMNPRHPLATFAVGNLETLADRPGRDVRADLLTFYRRHYSANLMALAVVGREPLDVLEGWVRERFSGVENRAARKLRIEVALYRPGDLPARLDIVPERERFSVSFSFPIAPVRAHWRSKPAGHIGHLLGHEGESSLLATLKRRGWAQGLSAGTGFDDASGATLNVNIRLTPQGARHTDEIAALLFAAVEVVRARGIERWLFDENASLARIAFRFAEKASPISLARRLASAQQDYPQEQVLRVPYAYDEWRPDLVRSLLEHMRPDNVLVTRVAPGLDTDRSSPWYETPYRLTRLTEHDRAPWSRPPAEHGLAIPPPNPFIPRRLAMLPGSQGEVPRMRLDQPGFRMWHLQDARFGLPKADLFFSMRSPVANDTPRHSVLTQLFVALVNDQLDAFAYPADLAGLSFRLYAHSRGMSVRISGYDDRQAVLLERILAALTEPKVDPKRFAILHAELKRGLENSRRDQPYGLAMKRLRDLLVDPNWTVVERLAVIDSVSATEVERFARHLLSRLEVVALVHGNVDAARAEELGERLHASLMVPARPVEVPRGRIMRLRRGDRLAAQVKVEHPESAVALYLQAPRKSIADRAGAGLLAQVLGSPFFDALRTEKKLGYVVFANALPILDSAGVVFIVQSPVAGAGMLQDEVRGFLNGYRERIAAMTEAEFTQHKKALTARVMEEERQLGERSDRFWSEIDRGNFEFDTRERLAKAIAGTSIEAFRALYDAMLDDERRRQIAVRAQGADTPASPPRAGAERVVTPVWARENRELLPG